MPLVPGARVIGADGMADVYLASDTRLDRNRSDQSLP